MTVSAGELGQVCSSLMDISLQLLASVKKLEQSLTQVGLWVVVSLLCYYRPLVTVPHGLPCQRTKVPRFSVSRISTLGRRLFRVRF